FLNNIVTGSGPDFIPGVENGVGTTGDDTFIDADDDCNLVRGLEGDDVWIASFDRPGSESDPQRGTCGDDVDLGEGGEVAGDTIDYQNTVANSPGVLINLPAGIVSGSPEDRAANAENAYGSEHDDVIIGSPENNVIKGRSGDDTISGGGGEDDMDGGPGTDTLVSGPGDSVTCNLATGEVQGDEGDTTTSFETCGGGEGDDIIYGTNGDDIIDGGGGNDQIFGGNGQDTIFGGEGDDFIDGQNGSDTVYGGEGNDTLRGGSNGNDTIFGDAGDDDIDGGNGDDTLDGGDGFDVVEGGAGNDSCVNGEQVTGCET
ncbi:MAG: adhesin, partial [Actinomycetota bacterium]